MTDLIARVEVAEITATVETKELTAQVGFTAPVMPDYFAWRQEYFDPYFHLPLNDPPGSTVAKALAGPDGVHGPGAQVGVPGIIRPHGRYRGVRYVEGDGETQVGDENTFRFIHEDQNFTVAFWVKREGGRDARDFLIATSNRAASSPGFSVEMRPAVSACIGANLKNGARLQRAIKSVGGVLASSPVFTLEDVLHVVATSSREAGEVSGFMMLYINGLEAGAVELDEPIDAPQDRPLHVDNGFTGIISGVLIDTRPWTPEEVQLDYLRGMGVW